MDSIYCVVFDGQERYERINENPETNYSGVYKELKIYQVIYQNFTIRHAKIYVTS